MTAQSPDAPATGPTGGRRRLGFVTASATLVASFAASASPAPLYNTYRAEAGLTNADLSLTVVAYFIGTLTALLCLGRLADHLGRRPAALFVLLLLIAGCLVLLQVASLIPLALGRFLMGLGCGLASSALMAYVVDTAPPEPAWLASVVTSQAPMLGLTLGYLVSGVLVEYGPAAHLTVYLVMAAALVVCGALLLISPETRDRTPGVLASLRPRVQLTPQARGLMPVAACIFTATWAMGGYYQAFGPSITADRLHTANAVVVALVLASYMAPSILGAPLSGRFSAATAQRLGMASFLVGVCGLLTAMILGNVVMFIVFGILGGASQGVAMSASLRALLHGSGPDDRASLLAAIYLTSYAGAMVTSLVAGQLSRIFSLVQMTTGYAALALLATVVTLIWARNPNGSSARGD